MGSHIQRIKDEINKNIIIKTNKTRVTNTQKYISLSYVTLIDTNTLYYFFILYFYNKRKEEIYRRGNGRRIIDQHLFLLIPVIIFLLIKIVNIINPS